MKKHYFLLLALFFAFATQAQSDWQLFRPGVQYLYEYADAGFVDSPVVGIKIGSDTCTEMYPALLWRGEMECSEIASSFMGYEVCQTEDETRLRVRDDAYVTIRQTAPLNEPWPAYISDNDTVWARVSFIQSMTFLGLTDSVKSIYFYRRLPNGTPSEYLPADNRPIKVSKLQGLISTFWFRDFPHYDDFWFTTSTSLMPLLGLSEPEVGLQNIDRADIFALQVGDELHIKDLSSFHYYNQNGYQGPSTYTIYTPITITEVELVPDTQKIRYHYSGSQAITWEIGPPASTYEVSYVEDMPGIWEHNLADLEYLDAQPGSFITDQDFGGIRIVGLSQQGFCGKAGKYLLPPMRNDEGCYRYPPDSGRGPTYIEGLAGPYYNTCSSSCRSNAVEYFRRDSIECGTPFDLESITATEERSELPKIALTPNPTKGPLTLHLPEGLTADLKLHDLHGRQVFQQLEAQGTLNWNLGNLPAGLYQLTIWQHGRLLQTQAVVKQ